jgi:glycosyltransferase involved in cell wall biosynthesis
VTIVTAVRNGAATIAECLGSVARQRYPDVEHVIVDGASTDGTLDALRAAARPGLRWISEPDTGTYDAMNKGIRLARGDYLLFLGADDTLLCDLGAIVPRLVDPHTIYYGDSYWLSRHRLYDGPFGALKLALHNICHQSIFYPRPVFEKYAFELRFRVLADWELNMRCWSDRDFRFEYFPVLVARFNDADGLSSRNRDLAMESDYLSLLKRHFPAHIWMPLWAAAGVVRTARRWKLLPSRAR